MWRFSPVCWNNGLPWWSWEVAVCPFPLGRGCCMHKDIKTPVTKNGPCARHQHILSHIRMKYSHTHENEWYLLFIHPGLDPFVMTTNCYWWTYSQAAELTSNLWFMLDMNVSSSCGNCVLEMVPIFLTISSIEEVYISKVQMVAAFSFLRKNVFQSQLLRRQA